MSSPTSLGITIPGNCNCSARLDVSLEAAPKLADLASLFGDLLVADMVAHHVNAPEIQAPKLIYLRRACWEGAIIAYGRCFGSGKGATGKSRVRLDEFLVHLTSEQRTCHDTIMRLRNKRIGHHVAVDGGQAVSLYAGIAKPDPLRIHLSDMFVHVETELFDTALLAQLQEVTRLLREKVGERIDQLRFALLGEVAKDPPGVLSAMQAGHAWKPLSRRPP